MESPANDLTKGKKNQIFLFDLIIAFSIILISVGIFAAYYFSVTDNEEIYSINLQIMGGLTQTKINDLNNQEVRDLFVQNKIRNVENSVAQQISEFHVTGNESLAELLTEEFVEDYIGKQLNFNLTLDNGTTEVELYSKLNRDISIEDSSVISSSSRLIYGFINRTESYGPHVYKLVVWE